MSHIMRTRRPGIALAAFLGLLAPAATPAETVDVSSTTMLLLRDQARAGDLFRIAPAYELLSISARGIENPVADDLQLVFSGWGAVSLGKNQVWYGANPPTHPGFGDVDLAYLQGDLASRRVQLRLGRQLVTGGVAGAVQLDGGHALVRLPFGLGASAWVGSPVSQRFEERGTELGFNPRRGALATGGRLSFALPAWGELGASIVEVRDDGEPSQRQVGADLRVTPYRRVSVFGSTAYDLWETRFAEASVLAQLQAARRLTVNADYRHLEPDLFLSRASILSVFADDRRNEVGAGAEYTCAKGVTVGADYHLVRQNGEDAGRDGHRAAARATWRPRVDTSLGLQAAWLRAPINGYVHLRAFASRQVARFTGTLDLQEVAFEDAVNAQKNSFVAGATVGYALGHGFTALVSGYGGATPEYERRFDLMAKLAYNQTYSLREVR
jgi:hypothetical protein